MQQHSILSRMVYINRPTLTFERIYRIWVVLILYGWQILEPVQQECLSFTPRALGLSTTWPIFIMDWSDIPINGTCENLEKLMGIDSIFYSKRSIVKQRFWRGRRGWVSVGMQIARRGENRFYHHTPMTVRTDTVQCLQDVLRENYNLTIQDAIEDLVPRPVDVSHFWPSNLKGVGTIESKLRTKVSLILEAMVNETSSSSSSSKLNAFVGLAGATKRSGRKSVKNV